MAAYRPSAHHLRETMRTRGLTAKDIAEMVSAERRKIGKRPVTASTVRVWTCGAGRPDGTNTGILQRLFASPADGWEAAA